MSAPNRTTGKAPRQREALPRKRKSLRLEMRPAVYRQLLALASDGEPAVSVVERLVLAAKPMTHLCR